MYGLLIVDDNALVRMTLSMSVDWRKWNVELVGMAHDGEEALRFCEEHHPDIVITDIKMPGKDGIYLMEHLSKKSPEIQMIAVSDAGVFEHAKLAMIYGCINYLLKPVKAEELNDSVRRAVTNIQRSRIGDDDLFDFYEHALMSNSSLVENMDIFFIVGKKLPSMDTLYEQVEGIERNYLFQFSSHNLQIILGAIECLNDTSMSNMREVLEFNKTRLFILRKIDKSCTIEKMDQIYRESLKQLSLKIYWCRKPFHGTRRLDAGDWGKNLNLLYSLADDEGMLRILLERLNASTSEDFQSMETNRKIITDYLKHLALLSIRRFDDVYQLLTMMDNQQKTQNYNCLDQIIKDIQQLVILVCEDGLEHGTSEKRLAWRVKRIIDENYMQDLSLASIASMVSYSPVYVSRTFKQCFGNNISTYLAERRMQEACALLVSTEWRVADIARSVGYTNYLNFAKRFKQIKEMAPNSFRKKYQL